MAATVSKVNGVAIGSLSKVCGVEKASIRSVCGVTVSVASLIDSYSETNYDTGASLYGVTQYGQAITLAAGTNISSVKWYMKTVGAPGGTVTTILRPKDSGVVGSNAIPDIYTALATSSAVAANSISSDYSLITFNFSPSYAASAGDICLCIGRASLTQNSGNYVSMGYDHSSPSHGGNLFMMIALLQGYPNDDSCFYLYGS